MVAGGGTDRSEGPDSTSQPAGAYRDDQSAEQDVVDAEAEPWLLGAISIGDVDPPRHVDLVGRIGVSLGGTAFLLAILGVVTASQGIQPIGNAAILVSLVLVSVAMILGMVFQVYVGDVPDRSG